MKSFEINSDMLSMGGAFYPTGYAFLMFPSEEDIGQVATKLKSAGIEESEIIHLTPQNIIEQIGGAHGESDVPLPSVGTEGETVRHYVELARKGHHAVMIHAPTDDDAKLLMQAVADLPLSYGQKYHMLAIEDLN